MITKPFQTYQKKIETGEYVGPSSAVEWTDANFFQSQHAFTEFIRCPTLERRPSALEERRLKIYQDLFYNNIKNFIGNGFPVIKKIYCAESEAPWLALVRDFFQFHSSDTPYFYNIACEFVSYIENERQNDQDPRFMPELAHYEWLEARVQTAEGASIDQLDVALVSDDELPKIDALNSRVQLSPVAYAKTFQYPVHQIGPTFQPSSPLETPIHLVVFRKPNYKVGFLELNAASAGVFEALQQESTSTVSALLGDAFVQSASATVLSHLRDLLLSWQQQGLIWGFSQ